MYIIATTLCLNGASDIAGIGSDVQWRQWPTEVDAQQTQQHIRQSGPELSLVDGKR